MTVRVYKSTDGSAPVLTGQVGSLTALLDAILVNGYGALTAAGWTIGFRRRPTSAAYLQNLTGANNPSGMLLYVDDTGPGAGGCARGAGVRLRDDVGDHPDRHRAVSDLGQSAIGVGTLVIRKSNTADATARAWTIVANGQSIYLFIETGDQSVPMGCGVFMFGDIKRTSRLISTPS
jgi:hypothetical protein